MAKFRLEEVPTDKINVEDAPLSDDLVVSLIEQGQREVVKLRYDDTTGRYDIVNGRRRVLGIMQSSQNPNPTVWAIVLDKSALNDEALQWDALIGNAGTPNYMGEALHMDELRNQYGYTTKQIASGTGLSISTVENRLNLMNLIEPYQSLMLRGELKMTAAMQLVRISPNLQQRAYAAGLIKVKECASFVKKVLEAELEEGFAQLGLDINKQLNVGLGLDKTPTKDLMEEAEGKKEALHKFMAHTPYLWLLNLEAVINDNPWSPKLPKRDRAVLNKVRELIDLMKPVIREFEEANQSDA